MYFHLVLYVKYYYSLLIMKVEILNKLEQSVHRDVRSKIMKKIFSNTDIMLGLSKELTKMCSNIVEIKQFLFHNNEDIMHFSGDILSSTFYDHWMKNENIEECFDFNLKKTCEIYNIIIENK